MILYHICLVFKNRNPAHKYEFYFGFSLIHTVSKADVHPNSYMVKCTLMRCFWQQSVSFCLKCGWIFDQWFIQTERFPGLYATLCIFNIKKTFFFLVLTLHNMQYFTNVCAREHECFCVCVPRLCVYVFFIYAMTPSFFLSFRFFQLLLFAQQKNQGLLH